jgi:chemotaxis protein methyltransferase CheR
MARPWAAKARLSFSTPSPGESKYEICGLEVMHVQILKWPGDLTDIGLNLQTGAKRTGIAGGVSPNGTGRQVGVSGGPEKGLVERAWMNQLNATMDESDALNYLIELIYERCRIRLHDGKQHLIKARLGKRMRLLGYQTLPDYCMFLRRSADAEEFTHVVNALTTNFTNFLREEDHFRFLVEKALPAALPPRQKRFAVWSAACASGEEPYSIAFYLAEYYPLQEGWDWHILATDISTKALTKAQRGIYAEERLSAIPAEWQRRYFQRGCRGAEGFYRIKPQLTERISFQQINLVEDINVSEMFPVIFCRNVMIYFDRPTQQQLVQRLSRSLLPKGYLLVGHAESLMGMSIPVRCRQPSIYQKD